MNLWVCALSVTKVGCKECCIMGTCMILKHTCVYVVRGTSVGMCMIFKHTCVYVISGTHART